MKQNKVLVSVLCTSLLLTSSLPAQQSSSTDSGKKAHSWGWFENLRDPYMPREVAPINLGNSGRLDNLLRAGKIYLSVQDVIALALENNLDIELQRYGPRLSEADLLRAQAGGSIRGIQGGVQSGSTQGGQGILAGTGNTNTQLGTTLPTTSLDPVLTGNIQWGHTTQPLTSLFTTGTNSLVQTRKLGNFGIQKGFLSGTSVNLGFNNSFLSQNSGRNDFNPSTSANAELTVTQHLLQGFGFAVNNRNIRIAKNNLQVSDLLFRQQVMATVSTVLGYYWDLVSYNEDVKVKRQALALNQKLYEDNKKQVEIGTLAPIEIVRAEAEVARSQQDLTVSETRVLQQETILKNAISRTGVASPAVAEARIVPTDQIRMPDTEAIQPVQDMMSRALDSRPEITQSRINIDNSKIGIKGTRNAMLPTVDAFVDLRNNGLAGQINSLPIPPVPGATNTTPILRDPRGVDGYFLGGYTTALSQIFGRNFPDYTVGVTLNIPLRNRAAQADMIRDELTLRQQELRLQQQINQVRVEVQNALISLQQARAQYQTAVKTRILQEQTLDAEQKKLALGASTIFFVIQAQRDLAAAQATEVAALSVYARARVEMDRATGQTIDVNNIIIEEARRGSVSKAPSPLPVIQ